MRNAALVLLLGLFGALVACRAPDVALSGRNSEGPSELAVAASEAPRALPQDCADLEAPPRAPDGPLSDDRDVARNQLARAEYGLPSDEASTRKVMRLGFEDVWGFAVTKKEDHDLMWRGPSDKVMSRMADYSRGQESFGGIWIDQSLGAVPFVSFTEDVEVHRAHLETLADEAGVRVEAATYRYADLEDIARKAGRNMGDPSLQLSSVAVAEELNRVRIGAVTVDDEVRAELARRFPPQMICLEEEAFATTDVAD